MNCSPAGAQLGERALIVGTGLGLDPLDTGWVLELDPLDTGDDGLVLPPPHAVSAISNRAVTVT
ncbi:MAG: hypothetical protein ACLPWG_22315 [Steroidobacteraceae bacterium]